MKSKSSEKMEIIPVGPVEIYMQGQRIMYANRLHVQVSRIDEQVSELQQRGWQTAVVLGAILCQVKAECQHGEWGTLFKSNSQHAANLGFSQRSANEYMNLYKECKKRSIKQLGIGNPLALGNFSNVQEISETLSQITDATSLRQAYNDFFSSSEHRKERGANLDQDRNLKGRPKKQQSSDGPEEAARKALELERADAEAQAEELINGLVLFARLNRGTLINRETRDKFRGLLQDTANFLKDIKD